MIQQKVKVISTEEPWGMAKLADGTIVSMRAIFVEVFQVLNDDGSPVYVNNDSKTLAYGVNHQIVLSVTNPVTVALPVNKKAN